MSSTGRAPHLLVHYSERFKRLIAGTLLVLMNIVLVVATLELIITLLPRSVPTEAIRLWVTEAQVLEIFSVFLTVLIALELVDTVEVYFREHVVHAEAVVLVATIALGRKYILLDPKAYEPLTLVALASITLALGVSYYLIRRAGATPSEPAEPVTGTTRR